MPIRNLGSQGLRASALGLGCMGMSEFYGATDDARSIQVLHRALELGINFWDTADMYGPYTNETLVGQAMQGKRDAVVLATKFGILRDLTRPELRGFSGKPDYVRSSCENSLKRLQTDRIDLYYLHRVDPDTDIEETVGAMAGLVKEGKIRGIGLSEVSPNTLRRAHSVHPITAVQSEYSLWTRDPEEGILEVCKELGVAFVAYSPLGRGFLTGQYQTFEDFSPDDYRRFSPRFQGTNFETNLNLVAKVEALAREKGCTASQLALAWVMAQGEDIFPIPGTKRMAYLEENVGALELKISQEELKQLNAVFPKDAAAGTRYPVSMMGRLNA